MPAGTALGLGGRWELSGRDWGAWNAVFGPRGDDGLPKPLWDGRTGKIDPDVLDHWRRYDLRLRMEQDWVTLGPKLRGKLHIWVGEADDYFLNNAVHLLDGFLSKAQPAFEGKITYGMGENHFWRGLTERELLDEMAAQCGARPNGFAITPLTPAADGCRDDGLSFASRVVVSDVLPAEERSPRLGTGNRVIPGRRLVVGRRANRLASCQDDRP